MAATQPRDSDEHYDRRQKGADEIFCLTCGAIIKREAEICPKCGVRNKLREVEQLKEKEEVKPKGAIGWLIFWIIVFWPAAIVYFLIRRW